MPKYCKYISQFPYLLYVEKSFLMEAFMFLSSSKTANMLRNLPSTSRYDSETKSLRFSG